MRCCGRRPLCFPRILEMEVLPSTWPKPGAPGRESSCDEIHAWRWMLTTKPICAPCSRATCMARKRAGGFATAAWTQSSAQTWKRGQGLRRNDDPRKLDEGKNRVRIAFAQVTFA